MINIYPSFIYVHSMVVNSLTNFFVDMVILTDFFNSFCFCFVYS